jgi:hypothetical protein
MTRAIRFLGLGLALLTLVACQEQNPQPDQSFSYSVDPALTPSPQVRAGKTLAAAKSAGGLVHLFIEDEILIRPKDDAELQGFLQRTGGTVIGDDRVPEPPPGSGIQLRPEDRVPTLYVVRVDPTRFSLEGFEANAQRAGLRGATVFSGERAARLLAGIVGERVRGLKVSPNFVAEPADILFRTEEHPLGSGGSFEDALSYPFFSDTGSRSSVALMFQLIAASPPPPERRARVAIIDGGFWLDRYGVSLSSDLPGTPWQYDFTSNDYYDYYADGTNPVPCSGGSPCPWHGTGAAHVAVARLNNRYGAAGTGGQVADAILFKTSFDWGQVSAAIRTAVSWGADVISMSFGAICGDSFCDDFFESNLYPALREARDKVVLVASAGNDGGSADGKVPCKAADVICVGALADGSNQAIGYSNSGPSVDIWAPTNIRAVYGSAPSGPVPTATFGGTSASAPFIAGIAAALKAYNPSLTSAQVNEILRRTAWTDSTDPKVSHYVNAYRALREVVRFKPDALEANNTSRAATNLGTLETCPTPTRRDNLNLHSDAANPQSTSDEDHFRFSLPDYASLEIYLRFVPKLGNIDLMLIRESGWGNPRGVVNTLRIDRRGRRLTAELVSPGTYRVVVNGPDGLTNAYNLLACRTDRPLAFDAYESNDTLGTARGLSEGTYRANLHLHTDLDHYSFNPTIFPGISWFVFQVTNRDMPLTLRLYDDSDIELQSVNCTDGVRCAVRWTTPGVHKVRVEAFAGSPSRGLYTFKAGLEVDKNQLLPNFPFFPDEPFFWLDPQDPARSGELERLRDIYVFQVGKAREAFLRALTEEPVPTEELLKLRLLDDRGNQIGVGQPSADPQNPGLAIPLSGLQSNAHYVLVVERARPPQTIGGEEETLGTIPYGVDLR